MVERVVAANEAAIAHHAKRDAEKEKEIKGYTLFPDTLY